MDISDALQVLPLLQYPCETMLIVNKKHAAPYAPIQESFGSAYGCGNLLLQISVMRRYAVLIDAGFLKRKRGSRESPLTAEAVEDFVQELGGHPVLRNLQLHRVYFYDAPPLRSTERKPLPAGESHSATLCSLETINACMTTCGACPSLRYEWEISDFAVGLSMPID